MERQDKNKAYLNRFSILLAFLALGFSLIYLVPVDQLTVEDELFMPIIRVNFFGLIPLILALVSAVGSIWVFNTHPRWQSEKASFITLLPHLTLPFIASLILAIVLRQSARSTIWWIVLLVGFLILYALLRSEYFLLDQGAANTILYSLMIISFSCGLFLIFTISLKNSDFRLLPQMLLIFSAAFFVTFRTLTIRLRTDNKMIMTLIVASLITQLAAGMHYLFIKPIQYGLILTAFLYALTVWIHLYEADKKWLYYKEPFIMLGITAMILIIISIF